MRRSSPVSYFFAAAAKNWIMDGEMARYPRAILDKGNLVKRVESCIGTLWLGHILGLMQRRTVNLILQKGPWGYEITTRVSC
jgi:hypothetical protein